MEFEQILSVAQLGGLTIIAFLFIYSFVQDKKDRKEEKKNREEELKCERINNSQVLQELSASNRNIAESLSLLKTSIDNNNVEYRQHDERAINQFNLIDKKLSIIEEKINK